MIININCAKCIGIQAVPVTVEVVITPGIGIHLVGMADIAVKESLLRTITALNSMGFKIPGRKIVINLAPADMHKKGSGYDLAIAIGIIAASGQIDFTDIGKYLIMGELGLDASVRPIHGALPIAEFASVRGFRGCILPEDSALETYGIEKTMVYGVRNLQEVLDIIQGKADVSRLLISSRQFSSERAGGSCDYDIRHSPAKPFNPKRPQYMDFADIIGQDGAKRGLEIAAAGGHNVIMVGPPGSGKTSLAMATAGIMPEMTLEEAIETSKIYSVAGNRAITPGLIRERPFRSPHYSASVAAIIGGGNGDNIVPGEISLAHNGILFLDEFAQMPRNVAETLRGPLEDRKVVISRLKSKVEFPASFTLISASNPCPCGYYGDGNKCTCTPAQRQSYMTKLSGPIMDRIDIQLTIQAISPRDLVQKPKGEMSAAIAGRVLAARKIQSRRFADSGIHVNAEMSGEMINRFCSLTSECCSLMERLTSRLGLSARAFTRVLKLSRTIADLEDSEIQPRHILEAAGYRFLDRTHRL